MGARISVAMTHAKKLITKHGYSVREASDVTGISRPAIYLSPWYKDWKLKEQTRNCKEYPK